MIFWRLALASAFFKSFVLLIIFWLFISSALVKIVEFFLMRSKSAKVSTAVSVKHFLHCFLNLWMYSLCEKRDCLIRGRIYKKERITLRKIVDGDFVLLSVKYAFERIEFCKESYNKFMFPVILINFIIYLYLCRIVRLS
jgi:hypothetical protein